MAGGINSLGSEIEGISAGEQPSSATLRFIPLRTTGRSGLDPAIAALGFPRASILFLVVWCIESISYFESQAIFFRLICFFIIHFCGGGDDKFLINSEQYSMGWKIMKHLNGK